MESLFKKRQERITLFRRLQRKNVRPTVLKEIPEFIYQHCPSCQSTLVNQELIDHKYVCPHCQHHFNLSANERIRQVCDLGSFVEIDKNAKTSNQEKFIGYDQKLEHAHQQTGLNEAIVTGTAKINGQAVCIGVMDARFMMGSMGSVVGDKVTRLIELATSKHYPLVLFCCSGGARMQEGIISLMQMVKTSGVLKQFDQQKGLYITILTHPTTGGVSASFAMLGDIILSEPKALVGLAGRRVIEKTINETLPEEFQTAEFVLQKGFIDKIVARHEMKETLSTL